MKKIRHLPPALPPVEAERGACRTDHLSPGAEKEAAPALTAACVTRVQLASLLQVSVRTVDRMIASDEIPVRHVRGRLVRILRSDAEAYLERENLKLET